MSVNPIHDQPTPRPATPDHDGPHAGRVHRLERVIATLLRVGVAASFIVVVGGTVLTFIHHPQYVVSRHDLDRLTRPGAAFPRTIGEVAVGLRVGRGQAVVVVGLLLLIATPVVRVGVSLLAFVYQRDRVFILITGLVLGLLLLSFILGRAEG